VPVATRIIEHVGQLWTPDKLRAAFPLPDGVEVLGERVVPHWSEGVRYHESKLPKKLLAMITEEASEKQSGVQRGPRFFTCVAWLKRLRWDPDGITALFEKYPSGVAAKYGGRLHREVVRAWDKASLNPVDEVFAYELGVQS
jgi:hypothetical protein